MTVYIIGGGLTGLTAAHYYQKQFSMTAVVFEKANTIGGLCQTHDIDGIKHEFGPHILYYKDDKQKKFWDKFVGQFSKHKYYVRSCIDGRLASFDQLHDFPISEKNLTRIGADCSPAPADFSNYENYMISQIGHKAYQTYVYGYNKKQWGIEPEQMSAEWAKLRPLTLKKESPPCMFGNMDAGHPVQYNTFFNNLSKDIKINRKRKLYKVNVEDNKIKSLQFWNVADYPRAETIQILPDDIVINTTPIDIFMNNINKDGNLLDWRGIVKIFSLLEKKNLLPTYSTTFPNNYSFTRIVDYGLHSGQKIAKRSLISFAFPYDCKKNEDIPMIGWDNEADSFIQNKLKTCELKREYHNVNHIYPVSTQENLDKVDMMFRKASQIENLYNIGRGGLFAYISMSRAVEMVWQLLEEKPKTDFEKYNFYRKMREQLW